MPPAQFQHLSVEETRNACFVRLLDACIRDDSEIRLELHLVLQKKKPTLMLNLSDVTYASAPFLTTLVKLHIDLQKQDRKMKIYNLTTDLQELFVSTKLHKYLDIYDTEDQAFQSLQMTHC